MVVAHLPQPSPDASSSDTSPPAHCGLPRSHPNGHDARHQPAGIPALQTWKDLRVSGVSSTGGSFQPYDIRACAGAWSRGEPPKPRKPSKNCLNSQNLEVRGIHNWVITLLTSQLQPGWLYFRPYMWVITIIMEPVVSTFDLQVVSGSLQVWAGPKQGAPTHPMNIRGPTDHINIRILHSGFKAQEAGSSRNHVL